MVNGDSNYPGVGTFFVCFVFLTVKSYFPEEAERCEFMLEKYLQARCIGVPGGYLDIKKCVY